MDLGHAIFKGILQGLTEFLPVSSTAHLIFTDTLVRLFGWHSRPPLPGEEEFFDILLHIGTLLAVIFYFRAELVQIFMLWFNPKGAKQLTGAYQAAVNNPQHRKLELRALPIYLAVSMVITVCFILGMLKGTELIFSRIPGLPPGVTDISEFYFHYPQWVAAHLIITGCLLFGTEWVSGKRAAGGEHFNMKHATVIGFAQGCAAIFHGISRSGSTISTGLLAGLDRVTATRYSFLLSIPTFTMAAVYEFVKVGNMGHLGDLNWPAMLVGTLLSMIIGYLCVKYFIQFVARHSLKGFAVYCWIMGISMLVFLNMMPPVPVAH